MLTKQPIIVKDEVRQTRLGFKRPGRSIARLWSSGRKDIKDKRRETEDLEKSLSIPQLLIVRV